MNIKKCECKDCGKVFNKGEQEDNEELCLRCDAIDRMRQQDADEFFDGCEETQVEIEFMPWVTNDFYNKKITKENS